MDGERLERLFLQAVDLARSGEPRELEDKIVSGEYRASLARVDCGFSVCYSAERVAQHPLRFEVECMLLLLEEDAFMGQGFAKRQWSPGDPPIASKLRQEALAATARAAKADTNFKARRHAAALARQLEEHCAPAPPRMRSRL